MTIVYAFIAGFVSTLVFHQGALAALYAAGLSPKAPFAMAATAPFHIPAVISLALWGGVWGIGLWMVIDGASGLRYWMFATLLGALAPSVVALFVVFPLKDMPMAGGWDPKIIIGALILNGVWGFGVALLMRLMLRL